MSFGFASNFGNASAATNNGGAATGPELETIQTEGLGFHAIAGSAKVRLVPQWSPPPAPTASLLTIASRQGLVAAASSDGFIIASTESVRKAFEAASDDDSDVRPFQPERSLSLPTRICQLSFTADESFLVLSAEQGGGLAAYNVQAVLQGSTQPAFQIQTNGESLRALVPNPQAVTGELCAVVTSNGKLLLASMTEQNFLQGSNGQILKEQVSCAAWSAKGKQIVAGLGDGTMVQMTPNGDIKAEIPRPVELNSTYYVSSVSWLENDLFFAFYVSTSEQPPAEACYLIKRQGQSFTFQKFNDPIAPFGSEKAPHQTVTRLKDFPPNLSDVLIVGSTATEETGLLTRAKKSLASNAPADKLDKIVDNFTTTELADDSRRATLPMGDGMDSPAPIGTALDLSSKNKVYKPIPADEIDESPGPLPGYWVLNDEGVLSIWWLVYNESIREGTTYSGMVTVKGNAGAIPAAAPTLQTTQPSSTPSAFGNAGTLGAKASPWSSQPSNNTGGASFGTSTFGNAPAAAPAASTPKFGAASFGAPSSVGFGQASSLGTKASPWGAVSAASSTPAFGQSSFGSTPARAPAATPPSTFGSASGSGFSGFASKGGFSSVSTADDTKKANPFASATPKASAFGSITASSPFGAASSTTPSTFGAASSATPSAFGATTSTTQSAFGSLGSKPAPANPFSSMGSTNTSSSSQNPFGSGGFKLQSSFQRDPNADKDEEKPEDKATEKPTSMFGSTFGSALNNTAKAPAENPFGRPATTVESTTPTSTPAPSKFFSSETPATIAPSRNLFGQPTSLNNGGSSLFGSQTPKAPVPEVKVEAETPRAGPVDAPLPPESTNTPATAEKKPFTSIFGNAQPPTQPAPKSAEDAPLPPDPVKNKKVYDVEIPPLPTSISKSKAADDAPLPPDPVRNKKAYDVVIPPLPDSKPAAKISNDAPLPPDPVRQAKVYDVKFPPIPGVKSTQAPKSVLPTASSTSNGLFTFPTNPPPVSDSEEDEFSDDEGDEEEEENAAPSEGSGVDVAKDLSPDSSKTPGITPGSSFDGGLGGSYSNISKPTTGGLFGEISRNAPPLFPRPNPVSPRSPSPVRSAVPHRLAGGEGYRSVSTPIAASQLLSGARQSQMRQSIVGKSAPVEDEIMEHQRRARAKKEADESRLLVDEEDAQMQLQLNSAIEPTNKVSEFIAHAGVAPPAADSIPAQVEAVYRDINSMIDTLGLNARALQGFIQGQIEFGHEERDKDDLATPDNWTLDEIDGLDYVIEADLGEALEEARVKDVESKLRNIAELKRELVRDFNKQSDLRKAIDARTNPDQEVANRAQPLSSEQAAQQNDLRREYARFTKYLAEAEEGLTLLKAKIVSANSASGKGGPTPTIEAVVRTITKMTSMVEKRSGDIDVLENQMRKLRFSSQSLAPGSREGSPFAAATPKKSPLGSSLMFSPERSVRESTPVRGNSVMRHSMSGSISSLAGFKTPPRKKLSGFGDAEKKALTDKRARRGAVLGKLKTSIEKRGSQVVPMDV